MATKKERAIIQLVEFMQELAEKPDTAVTRGELIHVIHLMIDTVGKED